MKLKAFIDTILNNQFEVYPDSLFRAKESDNAVIDINESNRLDSLNAVKIANRRKKELYLLAEKSRQIKSEENRVGRKLADPTTAIIRELMKFCYDNLGEKEMSREVSYIKTNDTTVLNNRWIEIVLKPNIKELYTIIKEVEKSQKIK